MKSRVHNIVKSGVHNIMKSSVQTDKKSRRVENCDEELGTEQL